MGVISFGAEKICFGLGGGVLVAHSGGVLDAARQFVLGYPSVGHTLARLTSTLIRRRWRRWTLPFQRLHAFGHERSPEAPPEQYRQESMANLNAAVARSLVASLPNNLQARRASVQAYRELLGNDVGCRVDSPSAGIGLSDPGPARIVRSAAVTMRQHGSLAPSAKPATRCKEATCRFTCWRNFPSVFGIPCLMPNGYGPIWSSCLASRA